MNFETEKTDLDDNQINVDSVKARKWRFVWHNVFFFSINHILSIYGIYLIITKAMWMTTLFTFICIVMSNVGVTAGAHRLWSHRAYKVNLPLKLIILFMYTMAYQGSVHQWARDHRVHHKYTDTDADPHNSTRGFFFSHVGWLLLKKHPDLISKGRSTDLSDIDSDPVLRFQRKYYFFLVFIISICIPAYIPLLWGENLWTSFIVAVILRHTVSLNCIFTINSAAHLWGYKPYDKDIYPAENKMVQILATGEGFHNYHHTFPWDYRAGEFTGYHLNVSRLFIDMMAKIGWAYDLRTTSEDMIEKRALRTGDGTHAVCQGPDWVEDKIH